MAKYDVTPELAETIKSVRIQNHISSKLVAEHIGKSPSYITKLEKGEIKTIHEKDLSTIFQYIFNNEDDFQEFLSNSLQKILDTLELRYTTDEIEKQLWFHNFDTVSRILPIPNEMVDDINSRLNKLNISIDKICDMINSNEDISPEVKNTDKYPFNEWQAYIEDHKIKYHFIKMKVSQTDIEKILNKETKNCNYITMLSMVYYLFKSEDNNQKTYDYMEKAVDYLNSYKFYSLSEKYKLRQKAKTESEFENLFSTFDQKNISLINEIIIAFKVFSEMNISKMNNILELYVKNLEWDTSFMMSLVSCSFYSLYDMSFSTKKKLLSEIQTVIKKYNDLPDSQKKLELYD